MTEKRLTAGELSEIKERLRSEFGRPVRYSQWLTPHEGRRLVAEIEALAKELHEARAVADERDRLLAVVVAQADARDRLDAAGALTAKPSAHLRWLHATDATAALGRELRSKREKTE